MILFNIKTSYEVLLTHFIDMMSQWSPHCGTHLPAYFDKEFSFTLEDNKQLDLYASLRLPLGWGNETKLLNWAHLKFPKSKDFSKLLPIIEYFEERVSKNGKTLNQILKERLNDINDYINIQSQFKVDDTRLKLIFDKFSLAFEIDISNLKPIDAFLTCSMNTSTQGGANGEGIHSEIPLGLDQKLARKRVEEFFYHESFHKIFKPRRYFEKIDEKYFKNISYVYNGTISEFADEVLTYLATTVYLSKVDFSERLKEYSDMRIKNQMYNEYYNIWFCIKDNYPLFIDYVENNKNSPSQFIKNFLKNISDFVDRRNNKKA